MCTKEAANVHRNYSDPLSSTLTFAETGLHVVLLESEHNTTWLSGDLVLLGVGPEYLGENSDRKR